MTEIDYDLSIRQYLDDGAAILSGVSDSPRLDAELLMGMVLRRPRSFLHAWPERVLDREEAQQYEQLLRRRFSGEPIAYMTGVREFWSMPLRVGPAVLIPRPDTELLVELALRRLPEDQDLRVLDLGTGSGAVALAIARERPRAAVIGLDISQAALELARDNARLLKIGNVEFRESDWFDAVRGEKFDVVAGNPPYVAEDDPHLGRGDARFEPRLALDAGAGGMNCFRAIMERAHNYIVRQGWLLLEHGPAQHMPLRRLMEAQHYHDITLHKDAAGRDRVTECRFVE
ncbi:peptide chain release factor N(5)-glutamine methyltransferase [Thioalkalivibrio sp. XN8]|uniref:peptide chain release factor N(5)-glutamine methyltransferase n=1 Tax=Thioalkalivibrio sp. XN8 TaxID=2712863 RepID=UPI0013EDE04E|nr:peptide chain release factor N(5)-glutamine methyltransferase [Thioalkalivibrio sp. XN8]NGP54163.1 peptide chain release factor N(5)-glutamine methyltransferase [Thioalkalivibrio sp. XN8]